MTNLLCESVRFGFGIADNHNPALFLFGFPIYVYALCIVAGMCVAIGVSAYYFKKRGLDPYGITVYALVLIPFGVLGARLYVHIFPWAGQSANWSRFFDIRDGGLGIYGGVIFGYLSAWVLAKIKKHDFRIVTDSILPGVMIAQCIGRWGNFANQEAYGNLITTAYDGLAHAGSGIFSRFNGYAVWIDSIHSGGQPGWYQATFFYESVCTLIGFLICVLVLTRSKRYKLGWCTAFYGIYYGIVRLVIEGLRSDSLFLYIGTVQTNIKISQLVSIFTIVMGVWLLTRIYRKQIHAVYKRLFKSDYDEMRKSRWILMGVSAAFLGVGIAMFVLSARSEFGQSEFIAGFFATLIAVYAALGVWSLFDRLKLYCPNCHECHVSSEKWQTEHDKHLTATICYSVAVGALVVFGLFSLIKWGIVDDIPNGIVLFVACVLTAGAIALFKLLPEIKKLRSSDKVSATVDAHCDCGATYTAKLNKFLLFVFPPKVYVDYGVENLKPWVDPDKGKRKKRKALREGAPTDPNAAPDVLPTETINQTSTETSDQTTPAETPEAANGDDVKK